jgi:hypothetical protein
MKDAEIEDFLEGFSQSTYRGMRVNDEYGFMIIDRKTRLYLTGNLKTALAGFRVIIGGAVPAIPKHPSSMGSSASRVPPMLTQFPVMSDHPRIVAANGA